MAHDITIREDGFAEMAFSGDLPWHGLGQKIDPNASIEEWQKASGMDWDILSSPARYVGLENEEKNLYTYFGQNVLYRSDTKAPLSIVSDRYNSIQPKEVLNFFKNLVEENGFKIHTAGTLRGGRRMWALAETGQFAEVSKGDGIGGFMLLSTSCDKSLSTTARFTSIRVVCNNTLTAAVNSRDATVSFTHLQKFDHAKVQQKLMSAVGSFGAFIDMAKHLKSQKMNAKSAQDFVKKLLNNAVWAYKADYNMEKNRAYNKILSLFNEEAKGIEVAGHTNWGMLNAVTEYFDHHAPTRNQDERLNSTWFGRGNNLKDKAVSLLLS